MPTLDEYLGGIFASLNQARMMADAQTASTAEAYARHDLLRHFSVPHLRFSDVELTIPVAIEAVQAESSGGIADDRREALRNGLLSALARLAGVRQLPRAATTALAPAIDAAVGRLAETGAARPLDESLGDFAKGLASDIGRLVRGIEFSGRQHLNAGAVTAVVRAVAGEQIKEIAPAARFGGLQVIAESHRLREQRPSDVIIIKLSISEEGMEWQNMEMSDGRTERKLLPE